MIQLKCPNCAESITLDENREFGFCSYCGSKFQLNETIVHKHTGEVTVEGLANVDSLIRKGFLEIDSGDYLSATGTFDKAMEINADHILVIVGKMLTKVSNDSKNAKFPMVYTVFDPFYYKKLCLLSQNISIEEKTVINEDNCKLFLKCFCLFGDRSRTDYIIQKYPKAITLDLLSFEHFCFTDKNYDNAKFDQLLRRNTPSIYKQSIVQLLSEQNPVDVIQLLLDTGIQPLDIFLTLYSNAYHYHFVYNDKSFIDIDILSLHVMQKLISAGLPLTQQNIMYIWHTHNADSYPQELVQQTDISNLFTKVFVDRLHSDNTDSISKYKDFFKQYESAPQKKKNGCYVATAIYGSYDCPEVWTLRRFRDTTLARTWHGRAFIRVYYALSPTLVVLFGKKAWFRIIIQPLLNSMVFHLQKNGVLDTPYSDREW